MKKIVALVLSLVMVLGLATTAFAVNPTVETWNPTGGTDGKGAWELYYAPGASADYDLDDFAVGADENCLPAYKFGTEYFVVTTEAAATYRAVYGATKLFLAKVDSTDVLYLDNADVFTNVTKKTDVCGKLVVTDTTKTYYAAYDEDTLTYSYYVATKNGSKQLLVDGKIVDAELTAVQTLTNHDYKGNDIVNNAYTTVKCANCDRVAKLYATATAAGKYSVGPIEGGYVTLADWTTFGASAPAVDADKVESAETFDAGIAMYVGMSVMAAAGSAVVLKKKD